MATWKKVVTESASGQISQSAAGVVGGINGISNVTITGTPANNEVLAYDSTSSAWINQTAAEAGLNQITIDTSLSSSSSNPVSNSALVTEFATKQDTITGGASLITSTNLTTNRALVSNGSGKVSVSAVTSTEIGYLDGVTSAIQTQLDGKQASGSYASLNGDSSENFSCDDLTVTGNLNITGDINSYNVTDLDVADKTITLAKGAASESGCDGAGIVLDTNVSNRTAALQWYNDGTSANQAGCIGNGWQMAATNENNTKYYVMGFKTGTGAPTSGDSSTMSTRAEGEGSFYWDSSNNNLYICTDSDSSNNSGS